MRTRHVVILVGLVLLIAALFTVLSRSWWVKRIRSKYSAKYGREVLSDEEAGYFAATYTLSALIYLHGHGAWPGEPDGLAFAAFEDPEEEE